MKKKIASVLAALILALSLSACNVGYIDNTAFVNDIAEQAIKAAVKIVAELRGTTYIGSGAVYAYEQGRYYALTNNHVAGEAGQSVLGQLIVFDCYGNPYEARLEKASLENDLAIVSFAEQEGYLAAIEVLEIAKTDEKVGTEIAAIGSPEGQFNTVTLGRILRYDKAELTGDHSGSEIEYPVICHSAVIRGGSSGGMLINKDLQIVGINYAGGTLEETGEFVEGYAVPAEKITNFLNEQQGEV